MNLLTGASLLALAKSIYYELMWCLQQEELLHLSIHNLTWQESNIGRFVNHNIPIQSKIVQELFEDV